MDANTASRAPHSDPHTARLRVALANLLAREPDYYRKMLAQRAGRLANPSRPNPDALGSVYPELNEFGVERRLQEVTWEPYEHPAVMPGCVALATRELRGRVGVVELATLDPQAPVELLDPKGTGFVEAAAPGALGPESDLTVAILGTEDGVEVVFTFFPGAPIQPSRLPAEGRAGTTISARDALALGLTHAKITAQAPET